MTDTASDTVAEWLPCSDSARARQDSMAGSASSGDRWFLIELSGGWGYFAFLDSPAAIEPTLGRRIVTRIEKGGMRPLAIRRPGRDREKDRWRWAAVDTRPGHESIRWGEVERPEELLDVPLDGSTGAPDATPIVAVCTHGKHDRCCAVRGRKVVTVLQDSYPDETWECSHLGGDRFAGTMIVFPHGLYYGRADDADAAEIVRLYRDGRVDSRFLRGRSSFANPVQVAQHHARALVGEDRIDALAPSSVESAGGTWSIVLSHPGGDVAVRLVEAWSEPIFTMCSAKRTGPVRTYVVGAIEVLE